jgi:MYXO-CTERM domain-containing protein
MKNATLIIAAGAIVSMASTAALGARVDSTYSNTGVKTITSSNVVAPGSARVGTVYSFDVANIASVDGLGSAGNTVVALDLASALGFGAGTPLTMNGIGWDVTITAGLDSGGASWLSEMAVYFDDNIAPDQAGLFLNVGVGNDGPGEGTFADPGIKLADVGIGDIALPDGVLRMEFFESFDDEAGIEGLWKSGFLNIQVAEVPAPGAAAILGLGGLVMSRRRR